MIRLIAAVDRKRGIAKSGDQPWNIPTDLAYFRSQTMQFGATALVGQRTFELIFGSRPLVDRRTLVVSRNMQDRNDIEIVRDLDDFWRVWQGDLWVVGGASIYEQALPHADELYLTEIEADFGCDQFFPEFSGFQVRNDDAMREENGFLYRYRVYRKGTSILVGG